MSCGKTPEQNYLNELLEILSSMIVEDILQQRDNPKEGKKNETN